MKKGILITFGITILFLGHSIQPSVAVQPETEIDIEPKDYLFQTIMDIAKSPDVKNLLEKYKPDLFNVDVGRSIYSELLLRNPRLMFNMLFTKPSLSVDYLNEYYNKGIEITNILGEEKVLEIIENVENADTQLLIKINDIISKNEEFSKRFEILKEMNKELYYEDYPILCTLLITIIITYIILTRPLVIIFSILRETEHTFLYNFFIILSLPLIPFDVIYIISVFIFIGLNCLNLPEYGLFHN